MKKRMWYEEVQVVELHIGNSDMSAHCPFCGHPSGPNGNCGHLLYIIMEGVFVEWSERFVVAAHLEHVESLAELLIEELQSLGNPEEIASGITLQGHVQFALQTVNDVKRVGFADIVEE